MNEAEEQDAVWIEAESWIGTPYHHRGQIKGRAADCAMFPLAVYGALGLIEKVEIGPYAQQWHMHRSDEIYLRHLEYLAKPVDHGAVRKGDFGVWRFGRTFSHGAILNPPFMIHAVIGVGVTMDNLDTLTDFATRPALFFRPRSWSD